MKSSKSINTQNRLSPIYRLVIILAGLFCLLSSYGLDTILQKEQQKLSLELRELLQRPDSLFNEVTLDTSDLNKLDYPDTLSVIDSTFDLDSIKVELDSTKKVTELLPPLTSAQQNQSPIDFKSNDSIRINLKKGIIRLRGEAEIETEGRTLQSEIIEIDYTNKVLYANGIEKSDGQIVGFPVFLEDGTEYAGKSIKYNYGTNRGTISMGETAMGEGFYYGEKIKRISPDEFFVKNGYYTTCDAGHPHYYFGSEEMKMVVGEEFLLCPMTMYVEDLPVFTIPFGVFLPLESGRRSGLIVPTFDQSQRRGLVFRDFGFYWAASDYWDTQITADWFTKGGFLAKNSTRWALKNILTGSATLEYGLVRQNPDEENVENFRISLNHNQEITPQDRITANLDFRSQDFNRNTQFELNQLIQQNVFSRASYNHTFDNGSSFSATFDRNQDIIDNTYSNNFPFTYTLPNKSLAKIANRDLNFSVTTRAVYSEQTNLFNETITEPDTTFQVGSINYTNQKAITFNPTLSYAFPKIYSFTITPSIGFGGNIYFRKLDREQDQTTGEFIDTYENGLFADYYANANIRLQTRLFGVVDDRQPFLFFIKPSYVGLKALRHVLEPSLTYSVNPDFAGESFDFFDTYTNQDGIETEYYRFRRDAIGTRPSNSLSQSMNWNLQNRFEAKLPGKEGAEDTNLELLQFNLGGSYDFTRDTFKHSNINLSVRTPALKFLNVNSNLTLSPYDQVREFNENSQTFVWRNIDQYSISNGNGLGRITSFNLTFSTSLSEKGLNYDPMDSPMNPDTPEDSVEQRQLGARFGKVSNEGRDPNYYGDNFPGYSSFNLPWTLTMNFNYRVSSPNPDQFDETFTVNAGANFVVAETWKFRASANFDFVREEILTPNLSLTKDLHCWELTFNWVPTGPNSQFWLRFGIKSSQLSDLFLEQRRNRQLN
ncbi:MAG: putative LPS assembly protein LptD [Candidatus Kapaibacteriales bacterium]